MGMNWLSLPRTCQNCPNKDILGLSKDILGFIKDILGLSKDILGFSKDILGLSKDIALLQYVSLGYSADTSFIVV